MGSQSSTSNRSSRRAIRSALNIGTGVAGRMVETGAALPILAPLNALLVTAVNEEAAAVTWS
jgi:hypothetical protein